MSNNDKLFFIFYQNIINIFGNWHVQLYFFSEICSAYKFHKSDDGGTFRWYNESSAPFFKNFYYIIITIHLQFYVVFQSIKHVAFH